MSLELKPPHSGGLLLTYWCSAACADCYENSSPRKGGRMPIEDAKEYLIELKGIGCSGRGFHFAGGEPFRDYKQLIAVFEAAEEAGMLPLGKLETNGFWCTKDELVRERLTEIKHFGLIELLLSCDVFHQEFVPIERIRRGVRIAKEILGEKGVRVRFWEFFHDPIEVHGLTDEEKQKIFREELKRRPERMVGRAAKALSHLVPRFPPSRFIDDACSHPILQSGHIHIDPYGNVFPSACAGISLGNAKKQKLSEIYETFYYHSHPLLKSLIEEGPMPLMEEAVAYGFEVNTGGYASKCHLCFEVRRFFFEKGLYPDEVGPEEIYVD